MPHTAHDVAQSAPVADESRGWQAFLRLGFRRAGDATELAVREHRGPLRVQRPFHPEGAGVSHVVLLHPPGGIVGGDELSIELDVATHAHALITTPAATKLYRSAGKTAFARQTLRVGERACLEWLPQETIAWSGARARIDTRVELAQHATFLGWEVLCLGRPASGERFETGSLVQRIELVRAGKPLFVERGAYEGSTDAASVMHAAWGLRGQSVLATFVCANEALDSALVERVREALAKTSGADEGAIASLSLVRPGLCVVRYLGESAERARRYLFETWRVLRPTLLSRTACAPRIWLT